MPVRQTLWELGNEDRVRQGLSLRVIAVRRGAPPHPMHAARLARPDGDYLKGKMLGMRGRRLGCRLCGRLRGLSRARHGRDQQEKCEMSNLLGGHLPSSLPHRAAYRFLNPFVGLSLRTEFPLLSAVSTCSGGIAFQRDCLLSSSGKTFHDIEDRSNLLTPK